jgi:hypothetical protein
VAAGISKDVASRVAELIETVAMRGRLARHRARDDDDATGRHPTDQERADVIALHHQLHVAQLALTPPDPTTQHSPNTEQLWVSTTHCPFVPHDSNNVDDAHADCPGAHTPVHAPLTHVWFVHAVPFTQAPLVLHVWGCVVVEHCVAPGAQLPVHDPLTHAWFEQAVASCQVPAELHVCGCVLDVHWV